MRTITKQRVLMLLPAVMLLLPGAAPLQQGGDRISHTVIAGESVSLICIDYYGYYSETLGKAVLADNPSIKNIDFIRAGQVLSLRKPVEPAAVAGGVADSAALRKTPVGKTDTPAAAGSPFIRKMSITQGVVTCVEGTVHWRHAASAQRQQLKINTVVAPGNVIETGGDGRVEIIINREAVVRLRENTTTVLEAFRTGSSGKDKTRIGCSTGGWWTKVKKFKDRISRFELELPTAVAGVHGTVYEASVAADGSSEVKVFSGEVAVSGRATAVPPPAAAAAPVEVAGPQEVAPPHEVSMEQWTEVVRSMQKITIDKKGAPSKPVSFAGGSGDWERWNEERDRRIVALFRE